MPNGLLIQLVSSWATVPTSSTIITTLSPQSNASPDGLPADRVRQRTHLTAICRSRSHIYDERAGARWTHWTPCTMNPSSVPCAPRRAPDSARGLRQLPTVFQMLPKCALMWAIRPLVMTCSTVIGGTSVKTVPLFAS
jgi:hypothetical protein